MEILRKLSKNGQFCINIGRVYDHTSEREGSQKSEGITFLSGYPREPASAFEGLNLFCIAQSWFSTSQRATFSHCLLGRAGVLCFCCKEQTVLVLVFCKLILIWQLIVWPTFVVGNTVIISLPGKINCCKAPKHFI